jgi:hypothetical protein
MEFSVHADGAWGGYFASLLREAPAALRATGPVPALPLSTYVTEQYQSLPGADTITVDPHKTGYLPYPAGALCYRNGAMRSRVGFEAPYINTAGANEALTVGKYGIEGSKPGAAAAGVYLSHAVIPPDQRGYGKILGRALYNCKLFHAGLLLMNDPKAPFVVVPGPRFQLPQPVLQRYGGHEQALEELRKIVRGKSGASLFSATAGEDLELLREIGADLNIVTYAFNFSTKEGLNTSLNHANLFNRKIYDRLGVKADGRDIYGYRLLLSTTDFIKADYGNAFFEDYQWRLLGVSTPSDANPEGKISVLRSVIMDPWIAEDLQGRPFIETIMEELRTTVLEVLQQLQASGELPA